MTRTIRRMLTFRTEHERGRFWGSVLVYMIAAFLLVCAHQARGADVAGGPDTPPARFAFPPEPAGARFWTAAERKTLRASRRGDLVGAMRAGAVVLSERFELPAAPDAINCAGSNPTRFTCGARSGAYQVVARFLIAPDSPLVVTRGWVKLYQTPIASAWAAQRGATFCARSREAGRARWGSQRFVDAVFATAAATWRTRDSRRPVNVRYAGGAVQTSTTYAANLVSSGPRITDTFRARYSVRRSDRGFVCVRTTR